MAAIISDQDAIDTPLGISDKEVELFQAIADAREFAKVGQDLIRQYVLENFPLEDLWIQLNSDGLITEEDILNAKIFLEEWVTEDLTPTLVKNAEEYIRYAENIVLSAEKI